MQQLPLQLELTNSSGNNLAGYRLQRYEVLNWGTFNGHPWALNLKGQTSLLTGANGSGKSTLVDGLLTLLVPNKGRNYNLASGDTGKRERNEKSYVLGAYDHTSSEESYGSKSKFLREEGIPTVILAYFLNPDSQQQVTLAQVLWVKEGTVKKFFVVAKDELTIERDFNNFSNISELKKSLKANKETTIFDAFNKYSASFPRLLGLQSDKALDLFNQTVSIKEIRSLNDFVRKHMLEEIDVQTKIKELQKSYENLTVCHNVIEQSRLQLEALIPLTEEAENYKRLTQEIVNSQQNLEIAPAYFAKHKFELLATEIAKIEQQLAQKKIEQENSDHQLNNLRQKEKDLDLAIRQDSVGIRLEELKREIKQLTAKISNKKQKTSNYNRLAELLELPLYEDNDKFFNARKQGEHLQQKIVDILQQLELQRDELVSQRKELEKHQRELAIELKSLRQRKSQIPQKNLNIRDRIADNLNLERTDLPFVGELLKVRDEATEWEGAIERLLKGFGLCILVAEQDYKQVNFYVNKNHLSGRLVYYRVTSSPTQATQRSVAPDKVPSKLEIKPDNQTFAQWLQTKLVQSYDYICCDSLELFHQKTRAITKAGLIKHSGERHEKDDSYRIGDRRNYILGWDNAEKIAAIEAELTLVHQKLSQINKQIKDLETKRSQRNQQQSWLQDFMNFTDFTEIDWRSVEQEKQQVERDLAELQASSDRLKQLESQLKKVQQQITETRLQRDSLLREIQTLEDNQQKAESEKFKCQEKSSQFMINKIDNFAKKNINKSLQNKINTETIDGIEKQINSKLRDQIQKNINKQNSSKSSIVLRINNFKRDFEQTTIDMGNDFQSLPEYIQLTNKIEQEDLPRHEARFKKLMTEKIVDSIVIFKTSLEQQEEEIKQNIDNLNNSLRQIDYTSSTYIELQYQKNRDREIIDFRNKLRTCLGDVAKQTAEDNEERFKNIQKFVIEPLKEPRWQNKVTDVRNWLDFSVSERDRETTEEQRTHTDSAALSGGQKNKLACTILASAIAYQFGLHRPNSHSKSFRFVVIDEAFSKLDDKNARYAMELFKNLNLQLLMITPKDKINITEPYISSLHLVSNKETRDYSSIESMSIEQFQRDRQIKLTKNRDQSLTN
ncbi:MAG: ATP-binding protein [Xenococcus sp. (in: cyanobacteria)]